MIKETHYFLFEKSNTDKIINNHSQSPWPEQETLKSYDTVEYPHPLPDDFGHEGVVYRYADGELIRVED